MKKILYHMYETATPMLASNFFSEQGLSNFCCTGKLFGQIGAYFPSVSLKERKDCLAYCIKKAENPNSNIRLVCPAVKIPLHVYIELSGNNQIIFAQLNPHAPLRFCIIKESSITEAFLDFFQSAQEAGVVLTQSQTLQTLQEYLDRL